MSSARATTWRGDEMTHEPLPRVSTLLPKDARDALIAASQIRNPRDRSIAVQEAAERAKRRYPQFFQTTEKE